MINKIKVEGVDNDTILWRYMDLSKFVALLSMESIWLARADTFLDKNEGKFHLEMQETLRKAYGKFRITGNALIKNEDDFQRYLIHNSYLSCWHENNHENMVMWEIYSQKKEAIAIKTTVRDLIGSLDLSNFKRNFFELKLSKVDYTPSEQIKGSLKYSSPFFVKRPHFSFESEVRLFLSSYSSFQPTIKTPLGYNFKLDLIERNHDNQWSYNQDKSGIKGLSIFFLL
jgi:hypothetical protein